MKAFQIVDSKGLNTIVFAESEQKAKNEAKGDFKTMKAERLENLDKFANAVIPKKELVKLGIAVQCNKCNKKVKEGLDYDVDLYCNDCKKDVKLENGYLYILG